MLLFVLSLKFVYSATINDLCDAVSIENSEKCTTDCSNDLRDCLMVCEDDINCFSQCYRPGF